jgi:hypothetical protein
LATGVYLLLLKRQLLSVMLLEPLVVVVPGMLLESKFLHVVELLLVAMLLDSRCLLLLQAKLCSTVPSSE